MEKTVDAGYDGEVRASAMGVGGGHSLVPLSQISPQQGAALGQVAELALQCQARRAKGYGEGCREGYLGGVRVLLLSGLLL